MSIDTVLAGFDNRLVVPLIADLTRTLEVTCHSQGDDNHGSNFVGNGTVLSGIETIAQFTDPTPIDVRVSFKSEAKKAYDALKGDVQKYVSPRYAAIDGSQLAMRFMRDYFDEPIANGKTRGALVRELIWAFRNPHLHAFYPYFQRKFNGTEISGGVHWAYRDVPNRIGIRIADLEVSFDSCKHSLFSVEGDWFHVCPQILFVFFKRAIQRFIEEVRKGGAVQVHFCENYRRLAAQYDLPT